MNHYPMRTPEQRELVELSEKILSRELPPAVVAEYDRRGEYPLDVAQKMFEAGLYGLNIPQEFGGMGVNYQTYAMLFEEMARFDPGFAFSFLGTANFLLLQHAASKQQQAYVAQKVLEEHTYVCFCLTEPDAGSDASALRTTYRREGDEFVLNGSKCFITNASHADMFIVAATRDRALKHKGISLFLVEKKHGVQVGKHEDKMGLRLSDTCDVILDEVRIPAENLLGEEGRGIAYCMKMLDVGRTTSMGVAVGIAQAALDQSVSYSKQRMTFGKPIIEHQGHGFMLADMQARVHACRSMVQIACQMLDAGLPLGSLSSSTKFYVSEECMKVTLDAVQALGGYGYMRDYPVEKMMRDMKIFSIFEGTNQICRMTVANQLAR